MTSSPAAPGNTAADDVVAALGRLDTCVVSDALDSLGARGALTGLRPLWPGPGFCGRAHTVLLAARADVSAPSSGVHLGARAIEAAAPGDVIVVANAGRVDSGAWGGLLSVAAVRRGVAGVVIDGACRDVDEACELGLPVFARAATPVSARGRTVEVSTDEVVDVLGLPVSPGDVLLADSNGVVVVPWEQAGAVAAKAQDLNQRERAMFARLQEGETVSAVLDSRYESMLHEATDSHTRR